MAKTRSEAVACQTPGEKKSHKLDLRATVYGTNTRKHHLPVSANPKTTRVYSLALILSDFSCNAFASPPSPPPNGAIVAQLPAS